MSERGRGDDSFPFMLEEIVLAKHQDRLYEARVLAIDQDSIGWKLYVHYCGWNKSFDEWLRPHELEKDTKENRKKKEDRDQEDKIHMEMEKLARSESKPKTGIRGRKRKVDISKSSSKEMPLKIDGEEDEEMPMKIDSAEEDEEMPMKFNIPTSPYEKKPMKIIMPPSLIKQLADDRKIIASGNLLELPRSPNVKLVLKDYKSYKAKKEPKLVDCVGRTTKELRDYFDAALPLVLLFKGERQQYEEATANNAVRPSAIYGAEHLLRLFLKLPDMLDNACIDDQKRVEEFEESMEDLLKFLKNNQASFFPGCSSSSSSVSIRS